MQDEPLSLAYYGDRANATRYHSQTGFDPARKEEMLQVTLRLLTDLTPDGASVLELGCGSGLFTQMLAATEHFASICATDGAEAMLDIARPQFTGTPTPVVFKTLDFTHADWASHYYKPANFGAVTSSMALPHAVDKQQVFRQVLEVLAPGGAFVFADHMTGSSLSAGRLVDQERARVKIGKEKPAAEEVEAFIQNDRQSQERQGNHCESVSSYLDYLRGAGFVSADCLWRSYWLAVFVAQKPG